MDNSYFEFRNMQYFVKCYKMWKSTNLKTVAISETMQRLKIIVVGEVVQYLSKVLLKICVSQESQPYETKIIYFFIWISLN